MRQSVITPDCPKCHGILWAVPCRHAGGCCRDHFECDACKLEWVFDPGTGEWLRFDHAGRVVEIIPPRRPLFRRDR